MNYFLVEDDCISSRWNDDSAETRLIVMPILTSPAIFNGLKVEGRQSSYSKQTFGNAVHTRKRVCLVLLLNGAQ
jgi:hypothetical protein